MAGWICAACGVQYADTETVPERCIICSDDRQYVKESGQRWTTLAELTAAGHQTRFEEIERGLHTIRIEPTVGIGQRTLLITTSDGNLLWDANGFIDEAGIERVRELGGIAAISASHPHMYGAMIEWSAAFGGAPVYVPEADKEWVTRPDPAVRFWSDQEKVLPEVTLVQCGGHFRGSATAYWSAGAEGRGLMLAGDTVMVAQDRGWVSFMRSYPNYIPLSAKAVRLISARLQPYEFDRLYDNFNGVAKTGAREAVARSAERYAKWVSGEMDHLI